MSGSETAGTPSETIPTTLFHQAEASDITQAGLISMIIGSTVEAHKTKKGPL